MLGREIIVKPVIAKAESKGKLGAIKKMAGMKIRKCGGRLHLPCGTGGIFFLTRDMIRKAAVQNALLYPARGCQQTNAVRNHVFADGGIEGLIRLGDHMVNDFFIKTVMAVFSVKRKALLGHDNARMLFSQGLGGL